MSSTRRVWTVEWLVSHHATVSMRQARKWTSGTATIHRTRPRLVLETNSRSYIQVIPISRKLQVSYNDPLARNFTINLETHHQEVTLAVFSEADGESLINNLGKSGARVLIASQEIASDIRDKDMGSFMDLQDKQVWRKKRMTPKSRRKNIENKTIWYCDDKEDVEETIRRGDDMPEILNVKFTENASADLRNIESSDGAKHSVIASTLPRPAKDFVSTSSLPATAKHSISTSTLSSAVKYSINTSTLPRAAKHAISTSPLPKAAKHSISTSTLPRAAEHSFSTSTLPGAAKHSISTSTFPRSSKKSNKLDSNLSKSSSSAALEKFLFLLPDEDSEGEFEPEKFGLYSEPGVIRFQFDDYPDSVLDVPHEIAEQEEGNGMGAEWIRTSYEDLDLDIAKTVKFEEGLHMSPHLTSMYSKIVSKSAGNIYLLEDSSIPEEPSYLESSEQFDWINKNSGVGFVNMSQVDEADGEWSGTNSDTESGSVSSDSDDYIQDSYC